MTGPNPYLAGGKIRIEYTTDEPLTHSVNIPINITAGSLPSVLRAFDDSSYDWTVAVAQWVALAKPMFSTTTTFTVATLYYHLGGIFIPEASFSVGVSGTGSTVTQKAQETVITYRTTGYKKHVVALLGGILPPGARATVAAVGAPFGTFARDYYDHAAGHIGYWAVGKDTDPINNGLFFTTSMNKKSRRRLNLG